MVFLSPKYLSVHDYLSPLLSVCKPDHKVMPHSPHSHNHSISILRIFTSKLSLKFLSFYHSCHYSISHQSFCLRLPLNISTIFSAIFEGCFPLILSPFCSQHKFSKIPVRPSSLFDFISSMVTYLLQDKIKSFQHLGKEGEKNTSI